MAPTAVAQSDAASGNASTPMSAPSCQLSDQILSTSYGTHQGPLSPEALLRLLRNQVCNDAKCEAPAGINSDAVVVARDDFSIYKKCEISVGLANGLEGYVFRQSDDVGDLQNDCSNSIDNMIDQIGGIAKECWWVGSHKNQVYQAGFRELNPSGNTSLHMQNNTKIAGFLADTAPVADVQVEHKKNDPKKLIPAVVGAVMGVIIVIISLIVFLIWKRNKREKLRWRAALERRAKRKAKKDGEGPGHKHGNHSTTLLGSLASGTKSWNPLMEANNRSASNHTPGASSSTESSQSKSSHEKDGVSVTEESVADEALARKLQRKYDAAHERGLRSPTFNDRDARVQSPQPPGYDAVNAGNATDIVQGPEANRISHFAPALGPDRCRFSAVTRDDDIVEEPPLPPPPPTRGNDAKQPWRDAEEYIMPQGSPGSPSGWRDTIVEDRHNPFTFPAPPQRPLPDRPVRSPTAGWHDAALPEKPLPTKPGIHGGWRAGEEIDDDDDMIVSPLSSPIGSPEPRRGRSSIRGMPEPGPTATSNELALQLLYAELRTPRGENVI